ncbi:TPA: ATP-grasp fold amidoligase family protein [Vibrio campbellii]
MLRLIKNKLFPYFPKLVTSVTFYLKHGYVINWSNPKSFNEKISIRKLKPKSIFCDLSDKFLVRKYVESKIGDKYLIPLLWHGKKLEKLDFTTLPQKYVIKSNHASGIEHLEIIKDSRSINIDKITRKFNRSVNTTYGIHSGEKQYQNIEPVILIEEFLGSESNVPEDYKFHIFKNENGQHDWFLQVDIGRFGSHKRNIYSSELNRTDFYIKHQGTDFNLNLEKVKEMAELAKILGQEFNYVRVDFYLIGERIYFGEMTFCHGGGYERFYPTSADFMLGSKWNFQGGQDYEL